MIALNKTSDKRLVWKEILAYSWHATVQASFEVHVWEVVLQNEPELNSHKFQCIPRIPNLIEISSVALEIIRKDRLGKAYKATIIIADNKLNNWLPANRLIFLPGHVMSESQSSSFRSAVPLIQILAVSTSSSRGRAKTSSIWGMLNASQPC